MFYNYIQSKKLTLAAIYQTIGQLQIINITLERNEDDAQAIFESLNSTGKELSQSDLIRNNVFMGLAPEEQNDIYMHFWNPMENLFSHEKREENMDKFFRNFLTMKSGRIPRFDRVYDEFKVYRAKQEKLSFRELCQDLYPFSHMSTETRKSLLVGNSPKLALLHNHVVKPFHPATPANKRGECTPDHQRLPLSVGVTEWIPGFVQSCQVLYEYSL